MNRTNDAELLRLGINLTQADQDIQAVGDVANGLLRHMDASIKGLMDVSSAESNQIVTQIDRSSDDALVEATQLIQQFGKQLDQAIDGQMLQVVGETRPLLQAFQSVLQSGQTLTVTSTTQQTTTTDEGPIGPSGFCIWRSDQLCQCQIVQGVNPPDPQPGLWTLVACTPDGNEAQTIWAQCQNQVCVQPPITPPQPEPWWCLDTYQCVQSGTQPPNAIAGPFSDLNTCVSQCTAPQPPPPPPPDNGEPLPPPPPPPTPLPPIRWNCDLATGTCVPSVNGTYPDFNSCVQECKKVGVPPSVCPPPRVVCPPPVVNLTCPPSPKPKEEEKEEPTFVVWQERDSKVCVITRSDEAPPEGTWTIVADFLTLPSAERIVLQRCLPIGPRIPVDKGNVGFWTANPTTPEGCLALLRQAPSAVPRIKEPWGYYLGLKKADGSKATPSGLSDWKVAGFPIGDRIVTILRNVVEAIDTGSISLGVDAVAAFGGRGGDVLAVSLLKIANLLSGGSLGPYIRRQELLQNIHISSQIPGVDAATEAFLHNSISRELLDCWVLMNGYSPSSWKLITDGRRSRLTPFELTAIWRRGLIDTRRHDAEIRGLGFLDPADAAMYRELSVQIPPYTDITRMMIRDVEDEVTIDWSQEDSLFKLKYKDQLKRWGEMQGIPDEVMKFIWRAHFVVPAPTQLYTFFLACSDCLDNRTASFVARIAC